MGKFLILMGVILIAVGLAWTAGEKFGMGRLPGDLVIERDKFRVYFPLTTSLIVSLVLSLILWLFSR